MTKNETFELLELIQGNYQTTITQAQIDAWHVALKNYSIQEIKQNLARFMKQSSYPPKVSDLIRNANVIPSVQQTREEILDRKIELADESIVQEELAKIRDILGIRRDHSG